MSVSGKPTSMIGLCQEAKVLLTRFVRSAGANSFELLAASDGLSARGSYLR
jgi:hypothetical protein